MQKAVFQRTVRETTWQMGRNFVPISMAASLHDLLDTLMVVALEKVSFSNTQNPEAFVITLTTDDKHYLVNRDNLTQPIQKRLSQKQKNFSEFFLAFLKSILNFQHLSKKMTQIADVFPDIPPPKNMVS